MSSMETVKEIINYFDNSEDQFSEFTISDKIKAEIKNIDERDIPSIAELYAFEFVGRDISKNNDWGTYYGPLMKGENPDGSLVEIPSYKNISEDILKYWEVRAYEAKHPMLKSRYADLVWDLTKITTEQKPHYKLAHIVIENNLLLSKKNTYKFEINVISKLKRALELALSLRDKNQVKEVKNNILDYEDNIIKDDKPGLWGFSFDILYKNNRSLLTDDEVLRIIASLENRIIRLKKEKSTNNNFPWAIEGAANRLADYYKNQNKIDEVKRVLTEIENAFILKNQSGNSLQKITWLENIYNKYVHYGLKDEAERLHIEIERIGPDVVGEMKEVSGTVDISKEKFDQIIQSSITGEIEEVLMSISKALIPKKDETEKQLKKIASMAPLLFLMTKDLIDEKGRSIAKIGSIGTDLESNIVYQIAQNLKNTSFLLRNIFEKLETTKKINLNILEKFIYKSPLIEENRKSIISKGIESFLQKDFITSIHVLVPQIENALRILIKTLGGSVLKTNRYGGFQYKNFEDLLRDEKVETVLGYDCSLYFRVLFTDQRGWNIRNNVCHGIISYDSFNQSISDHVFHSLLIIGMIRKKIN